MVQHRVVLLSGDGIGPEITAVARRLLEAVSERHGFNLTFDEQLIGGAAIVGTGDPLPATTLEAYVTTSLRSGFVRSLTRSPEPAPSSPKAS